MAGTPEHLRNTGLGSANHVRQYRLDPESKRLKSLDILLHAREGDVLVFRTVNIEYDGVLRPDLFVLEIPEDASWHLREDELSAEDIPQDASPREAAQRFFEALSERDWGTVAAYWGSDRVPEVLKTHFGGLELLELGETYQAPNYPGWYVPYKVRMPDGRLIEHNLAVQTYKTLHGYYIDGGL